MGKLPIISLRVQRFTLEIRWLSFLTMNFRLLLRPFWTNSGTTPQIMPLFIIGTTRIFRKFAADRTTARATPLNTILITRYSRLSRKSPSSLSSSGTCRRATCASMWSMLHETHADGDIRRPDYGEVLKVHLCQKCEKFLLCVQWA